MMRELPVFGAVWAALRAADRPMTRFELWQHGGGSMRSVGAKLHRWAKAGFVETVDLGPVSDRAQRADGRRAGPRDGWRMLPGAPLKPPPTSPQGKAHMKPSAQDRLWLAMRAIRQFGVAELAYSASCPVNNAEVYVGRLLRAGYVRRLRPASAERGPAIYLLARCSGPRAPVVSWQRHPGGAAVFTLRDPNSGAVVPLPAARPPRARPSVAA